MYNHFRKIDWHLSFIALFISGTGLFTIYNIGSSESMFYLKKQIIFLCLGLFIMIFISFFDYRALKNHSSILIILYLSALFFLFIVLFCQSIRGASSWFRLGPINLEPIEFVKLIIILFLAKYFSLRHIEMYNIKHLIVSGFYVGTPVIMVLLQPDFGSSIILCCIWLGLVMIAGIKMRHLVILFLVIILLFAGSWFSILKGYQKQRILTFLDPQKDPYGSGYHVSQSLITIGSGGLFGQSAEGGLQAALKFLPEQYTDFIFAAWAEQRGFAGILLLLILFAFLIWRIIKIALNASNNFSRLFASGFAIMLLAQLFINIGMNMAILPITGLTLPLVSYGGSSLISIFLGLGILQSINVRS
ncbi:rod shape-determining protein RodA [Patescibacteria group bacterium]